MIFLYGDTEFELFEPTLTDAELQVLIANACDLLETRGEKWAHTTLSSVPFRLSVATNDFGDDFNVLHASVSLSEYERLRNTLAIPGGKQIFGLVADVLSEIGPYVRCIACYLDTSDRVLPAEQSADEVLAQFTASTIRDRWRKALERQHDDPEGAITMARSLLESVLKHVLDQRGVQYDHRTDLPKLYRLAANAFQLAPSQHTEEVFRQILGGCTAVVEGLGTLRNRLGDAHGKGARAVKPARRHSQLAVNLAGTMATYLIETFEERMSGGGTK